MSKQVNAVTKSVPNSGKLFQMNMVLIHPVNSVVIPNYKSKESMFIIMKQLVVVMFHVLSSSILNQVPWIQSVLVHLVNYLDQITLFLVNQVPVTTGLKVIILKVLN